jgi:hypothetical protein
VLGQDVFGPRHLTLFIEPELAEGRARKRQVEQHHIGFEPIAFDLPRGQVVEVALNSERLLFDEIVDVANDLGLDRSGAGEDVHHRLRIEADDAFEQHRMERAARAFPWIGALFVL